MGRLAITKNKIASKEIKVSEVAEDVLKKAQGRNAKINAYLEIFADRFMSQAKAMDSSRAQGRLAGIPLGIKDMISIKGQELNASSQMLKGYRAPRSATVTERLEQEGALFLGRLNCDEFAMGSSNENTSFGAVRNPYDLKRTAGGSSGGSAAAVRADMALGSLGTDTGGSIRLPAAFCGLVGLKPTYGRVSRSGVIAFASSLDQVGPFADDAVDCAEIFQVIAGKDPRDATTLNVKVDDYVKAAQNGSLKGLKVGLPKEYFNPEGMDPDVQKITEQSLQVLRQAGAELIEVSLPHTSYGIAVYYVVATAEASSNLMRYDGIRYGHRAKEFKSMKDLIVQSRSQGFGDEVKRRIMLGTFALSSGYFDAYYSKAQWVRSKIQSEFLAALDKVDVLFTPVSPSVAFEIGQRTDDPLKMYLSDIFTVSINLAGVPAIAFPIGHTPQGLPVGAQFIGRPFAEAQLFHALNGFERACPIERRELSC